MTKMARKRMKVVQMALVVLTGSIGLITGILYGKVRNHFKNCPFYANVSIEVEVTSPHVVAVRPGSVWGRDGTCDFITFEGVIVFINSFIWLWFYIHMENIIREEVTEMTGSRSGTKLMVRDDSWRLQPRMGKTSLVEPSSDTRCTIYVMPQIVLNSMLLVTSVIRAGYASDGYHEFCSKMCLVVHDECVQKSNLCDKIQRGKLTFVSVVMSQEPFAFHDAMEAAMTLSWLEPMALTSYMLVVILDVYLVANPAKHREDDVTTTTPDNSPAAVDEGDEGIKEENRVHDPAEIQAKAPITLIEKPAWNQETSVSTSHSGVFFLARKWSDQTGSPRKRTPPSSVCFEAEGESVTFKK